MINVFIQNEAGSRLKHLHDERTFQLRATVTVSMPYPYPYGFVLDTMSPDGDRLDCYVLTDRPLRTGSIVECRVLGLLEQFEDGEEDHNIIAGIPGERATFDDRTMAVLLEFITGVFQSIPGKQVRIGRFLGPAAAESQLLRCSERANASDHS